VIGRDTIGRYYTDRDGQLWQHIAYTDQPTACLAKVSNPDHDRIRGVVGSKTFEGFTPLVPLDVDPVGFEVIAVNKDRGPGTTDGVLLRDPDGNEKWAYVGDKVVMPLTVKLG
jgi:hypothetical protein